MGDILGHSTRHNAASAASIMRELRIARRRQYKPDAGEQPGRP